MLRIGGLPWLLLLPGPLRSTEAAPRLLLADSPWNRCHAGPQPDPKLLPAWSGNFDDFFDDYRQLKDVDRFIDLLQARRPDLVEVKQIGTSWEGRRLRLLEITDRSVKKADEKPSLVLEGGIHAREWIATATVLFIASAVLRDAAKPEVAALLQDFVVSVTAPVNPDGYVYSWEHDRMWRKTRSNRADLGCRRAADGVAGVDANRNWGYTWGITEDAYYRSRLRDPCQEVYIGPAAFSEPEVKAVADYMAGRQDQSVKLSTTGVDGTTQPGPGYVAAFFDYHSYAQVLLPPWAYTASFPTAPDGDYQTGLTTAMVAAIRGSSGRSFQAGPAVFPPDPGTGPDWAYGKLGVRATMTVELEGAQMSSTGFCLPSDQIRGVGEEQWAALLAAVAYLRANGHGPSSLIGLLAERPSPPAAGPLAGPAAVDGESSGRGPPGSRLRDATAAGGTRWSWAFLPALLGAPFCLVSIIYLHKRGLPGAEQKSPVGYSPAGGEPAGPSPRAIQMGRVSA